MLIPEITIEQWPYLYNPIKFYRGLHHYHYEDKVDIYNAISANNGYNTAFVWLFGCDTEIYNKLCTIVHDRKDEDGTLTDPGYRMFSINPDKCAKIDTARLTRAKKYPERYQNGIELIRKYIGEYKPAKEGQEKWTTVEGTTNIKYCMSTSNHPIFNYTDDDGDLFVLVSYSDMRRVTAVISYPYNAEFWPDDVNYDQTKQDAYEAKYVPAVRQFQISGNLTVNEPQGLGLAGITIEDKSIIDTTGFQDSTTGIKVYLHYYTPSGDKRWYYALEIVDYDNNKSTYGEVEGLLQETEINSIADINTFKDKFREYRQKVLAVIAATTV